MLRGGDGCAPTQRKGWGGFGGVSSPLVLPLGGWGVCIPCEGIAGEWLQLTGWGGGGCCYAGEGDPAAPEGLLWGQGGVLRPPLPGNPLRDVGFWGLKTVKAGTE